MIEIEQTQPENEDKKARRRGGLFDSLAHVLRGVREIVFKYGFVMRNRPGLGKEPSGTTGYVPVKNMFEATNTEDPDGKLNAMMFGRSGDGENRKTNLIELCATAQPEHKNLELGYSNGVVKLRAVRAGENPSIDRSGVTVGDVLGFATGDLVPGVTVHVVGNGYWGGVVLSHITNKGASPTSGATGGRYILINDTDISVYGNTFRIRGNCTLSGTTVTFSGADIRMTGLPTTPPSESGRLWNSSGTLRIT